MKKSLIALVLVSITVAANAATWWVGPTLFGNVCRSGVYYTVYPRHMGQPVGSMCPVRDGYGNIMFQGIVSDE